MSGTKRKTPSNSYKINIALPRMSNGSFGLQITQTLLGSMIKVRIDKCKNTKVKGAAIVDLSGCIIKSTMSLHGSSIPENSKSKKIKLFLDFIAL